MFDPAAIRKRIPAGTKASVITSDVVAPTAKYEAFRGEHNKKTKSLIVGGGVLKKSNIDVSWLEAAADTFAISSDPMDYILVSHHIVNVDIPNRNMQSFPYEEISYHDPMLGMMVYSTFGKKATNINHDNQDPLKAKGIIFDASLDYIPEYDVWSISTLCGFDRTKDKHLADAIISGKRPGFSMGATCTAFICSICGAIDTNIKPCKHLDANQGGAKGSLWDKNNQRVSQSSIASRSSNDSLNLAYQICCGVCYFEISSVDDPADPLATIAGATNSLWIP